MGVVSAFLTLELIGVVVVALWLARNPRSVRAVVARPWASAIRWLRVHLGDRTATWWPTRAVPPAHRAVLLVAGAGALLLCALAAVFAYLTDSVLEGDGITVVDLLVSAWLAAHREPALTTVMRGMTTVGNPPVLAAVTATVCAAVAVRRRTWAPVPLGAAALAGFGLAVLVVKLAVGRPRPDTPFRIAAADGYSFPSGHATGIAVVAATSAWMIAHWCTDSWRARVTIWTVTIVLVGGVGFSRVYLGVHYVGDVIAGWVLGAGWAAVLVAGAELAENRPESVKLPWSREVRRRGG